MLNKQKSSWLGFLPFGFILNVFERNVNLQSTGFLPVNCPWVFVVVVCCFLNDSKALLFMYLYFFPGHLDISWKQAKVYHLAFISIFKTGNTLF